MPTFHILADTEAVVNDTVDLLIEAEDSDEARERARLFLQTRPKAAITAKRFLVLKTRAGVPSTIRIKKVQEVIEDASAA